jgi:hypothetical protein
MTTEATPPKTLDQINAPAELKALVDPASSKQISILDRFLDDAGVPDREEVEGEESPAAPEAKPAKLAGKFETPAELEKAYLKLQRKQGQQGQRSEKTETPPAAAETEEYTPERGAEVYGEALAARFQEAEVNPFEMAAKFEAGEDVTAYVDALAEKGGLPRALIETYLAGVKPADAAAPATGSLNDQPEVVAALRQSVGGDAAFDKLSQWAAANLAPEEKIAYQRALDTGNPLAVQFALQAFQARAGTAPREPEYLGGGAQTSEPADVYETQADWRKDRYAKDDNGNERYLKDESYQRRLDAKFARTKRAKKW